LKPYAATPEQVARYRDDRDRFRLVFRCTDCVHVVPSTRACSFGFPNRDLLEADSHLDEAGYFVFCKYFEVA
jgi:hypothetical protein